MNLKTASLPFLFIFPFVLVLAISGMVLLSGCGGSETAALPEEESGLIEESAADTTETAEEATTEEEVQPPPVTPPPASQSADETLSPEGMLQQAQRELDSLRSANLSMGGKLTAYEKKNRDLLDRITALEASQAAARLSAAKELKKTVPDKSQQQSDLAPKSTKEQIRRYNAAVELTKKNRLQEAIAQFQNMLDGSIGADYADNCRYWMGLCFYSSRESEKAMKEFSAVGGFAVSEKKADAQLMIAKTYEQMGNKQAAMSEYKNFLANYPKNSNAPLAKKKLGIK